MGKWINRRYSVKETDTLINSGFISGKVDFNFSLGVSGCCSIYKWQEWPIFYIATQNIMF